MSLGNPNEDTDYSQNRRAKDRNMKVLKEMMNSEHLVIDLETVDREPTAGILSIGAAIFIPDKVLEHGTMEETFYVNVDVETCINIGMTFSWDTIMWWIKQDKEAGEALHGNNMDIHQALYRLEGFIEENLGTDELKVWGNANMFDISILNNAYRLCNIQKPWNHKQPRDLVTLEGMLKKGVKEKLKGEISKDSNIEGIKHNALYDAIVEAYRISYALQYLS